MTTVIDERVVEMRFNNADFEKNVAQSMNTLDQLKKSLNFDSGKSLEDLGRASKNFSLSGISESVKEVSANFSLLDIAGVTALTNITNKAVDAGLKIVKSLTLDQITAGWQKYADKTTAVQTIIASTGLGIETVEKSMERLNWFTDETSYNFVDMVSNIGKFTSAGVELGKAQSAMQGIANWATRSGQNATVASRVMYNFAQAMGAGAMQTKDWMSIENANMATKEFKQTALETAAELGKLKQISDTTFTTLDGKVSITAETLRDSLKKKWFDSEVMVETLNKYNRYADELYELSQKTGRTATQLMMDADQYAEGTLKIENIAKSSKISVEELSAAYESLNSETNKLSREAFQNAQEAKTFQEVMDATADAVSTGWMNTFQLIFGNYEEAKALWTGLANAMVELFTATGTARNEILGFWKDALGRESLIRGLIQMLNLVVKPLSAIKAAFTAVMPGTEAIGNGLASLTKKFEEFMNKLQPSQETLTAIYMIFKASFSILKSIFTVVASLLKALSPVTNIFVSIVQGMGTFLTYVAAVIAAITEYATELGVFETVSEAIATVFSKITEYISKFISVFGSGLLAGIGGFIAGVVQIISLAGGKIAEFLRQTNILGTIASKVGAAFNFLRDAIMSFFTPVERATTVVKKATKNYAEAADVTVEFGTLTKDAGDDVKTIVQPVSLVAKALQTFGKVVLAIGGVVATAFSGIIKVITFFFKDFHDRMTASTKDTNMFGKIFSALFGSLRDTFAGIGISIADFFTKLKTDVDDTNTVFGRLVEGLKNFITNADTGRIAAIALSIGLLAIVAASVKLAGKVSKATDSVIGVATTVKDTISGIGGAIKGTFNSITRAVDQFSKKSLILETIKTFAIAFTMVAASLTVLSLVPTDKLLVVTGIMLGFITIFTAVVVKLSKKMNDAKFQLNFRAMAKSIILLASSMAILAASVSILAGTKIEGGAADLWNKVGAAIVMLASVVGAAIALSRFSKDLPRGAILLLAIAFAMRQLAIAVKEFASLSVDNINDHWGTYLAIFAGLSLVMAAAGHVKVTSSLALLALAASMKVILPAISQIVVICQELPYDKIAKAASDNMVGIAAFFGGLAIALGVIIKLIMTIKSKADKIKSGGKNLFGGIGGTIAGIGIGVALIVASIKKLHELYSEFDEGELRDIGLLLGGIVVVIGVVSGVLTAVNNLTAKGAGGGSNKAFAKMALMMVGLAVAIRVMVSAVKALSTMEDMGKAWQAVGMVVVLGALMATIVGVAGTVQKAVPAMAALITAVVAVGILIGEIAILSLIVDNPGMNKALAIMAGIFVALNVTMRSLEKIKDVKAGPILGVLGIIAVVCGTLVGLSKLNFIKVLASAASMSIVMLSVAVLFKTISKVSVDGKGMLKKIGLLALTTLALTPIAVALYMLAKVCNNGNWGGVIAAAAGMSLALLAVAGVLAVLSVLKTGTGQLAGAGAIFIVSAALIEIALALKVLEGINVGEAAGKVAALLGIVSGIILVFGLISMIPGLGEVFMIGMLAFAATILAVSAAFAVLALSLEPFANGLNLLTPALASFLTLDFATMLTAGEAMGAMAIGLGALGLAGILVGVGALGLVVLAGALYALGLAAPTAADGLSQLQNIDLVGIALGLAALGTAGAVVGLMSPLLALAAAGIVALAASLLILNASLQASARMFDGFLKALDSAITGIKTKITEIVNAFKKLLPDIGAALKNGSGLNSISGSVNTLVAKIAGKKGSGEGILGGLSQALGWASPPQFILDLLSDIGVAFGQDGAAVSAAGASGTKIGNIFGSNLASSISGWLSNVGSGISSFLSSIGGTSTAVFSSMGSDLDSTGAQAEKFGKKVEKSGEKVGLLGKIQNKANEYLTKGKEEIGNIIGLDPADFLSDVTEKMEEATSSAGGLSEGIDEVGESAGKAGKSVKEFGDSLKETLEGQLNFFEKLELKTETTSEQLLENMRSNIDGFASWSHRMTVLAERFNQHGIDISLYEELANMGVQGYDTMNAIYQMTDEQLEQLRALWAEKSVLPENQANIVMSGYQYMGEMATQGFSDALNDHKAAHEAAHGLGKAALDGLAEVLEVHSPSEATKRIGDYTVEGLAAGIDSVHGEGLLYFAVKHVCEHIMELFQEGLSPEAFTDISGDLLTNLFEAMLGGENSESNPLIAGFISGLKELTGVDEALIMFSEFVQTRINELFEMGSSESPSMLFYRYGMTIVKTFADAILENIPYVYLRIVSFGMAIKAYMDEQQLPEKAYDIGMNIALGLAAGIADYAEVAIKAAEDMLNTILEIMEEIPEVESPSKVTTRIGRFISLGLAIGLKDAAKNVYDAAESVSEGAIEGIESNSGRIQDLLDSSLDLNPVITPMLDLSIIRSQMEELNALMSDPSYGIAGQNGGALSENTQPYQQINYTQNNYSPKALSRVEIYRDTKNALSMMKGALKQSHG